jgi:hypothetical protein
MAQNNINLMPEDLRSKEESVKAKAKDQNLQPDLSVPNLQPEAPEAELSGAKSKKSFWSKFSKPKKVKEPSPVAEEGEFKPLPKLETDNQSDDVSAGDLKDIFEKTEPAAPTKPQPVPTPEQKPEAQAPATNNNQGFSLDVQPQTQPEAPEVKEDEDKKFHQPTKRIRAKFVESGMGVDLVPTSAKVKSWKQISTFIIISFIASVGLIVVFYFGLLTVDTSFNSTKTNTLAEIENIKSQLLDFQEISEEINNTGNDIATVLDLLNKHVYWTNFFDLLEEYTLDNVYYTGFASSNNGALTLAATAPDYYSVAKQLKILQQEEASEFITDVDISSASASDSGVDFSISLTLNPGLFYYQTANLQ